MQALLTIQMGEEWELNSYNLKVCSPCLQLFLTLSRPSLQAI